MSYKILYIEDLDPGSIVHDLIGKGFDVEHHEPKDFEKTITAISGYDLLLIDFRLTGAQAMFDAPTIAQTLRTTKSNFHLDIPMVLVSSEPKINDYYNDLTSQDLFDLVLTKSTLLENLDKFSNRFKSIISAYQTIKEAKFDANKILVVSEERAKTLDYRIYEKLNNPIFNGDVFAFSSFILKNIVRPIGVLIGEDVLASRLGVSKTSPDWQKLITHFDGFKYNGIFSDSYTRWWNDELNQWWKIVDEDKHSLRRLDANQRVELLKKITGLNLEPQSISEYANGSHFWTICKETHQPLDPIDGFELNKRDLFPWQDNEFLSIGAALFPSVFDGQQKPVFLKYLKPLERRRFLEIAKTFTQ